jgi:nucleoside-diphosphate-sugar epimerase
METRPTTAYGRAKDELRRTLQALQRTMPFVLQWARLFYMYGEGQNPRSLLAQLDQAIARGDAVFKMSGGEQVRDYLPVTTVAEHLVTLVEHPDCDGVLNICSGKPVTVRHLVEQHLAERGAQIRLQLGHYPYPDYEPMAFWGEPSRLLSLTGQRG